jgi:hypothetical protein
VRTGPVVDELGMEDLIDDREVPTREDLVERSPDETFVLL